MSLWCGLHLHFLNQLIISRWSIFRLWSLPKNHQSCKQCFTNPPSIIACILSRDCSCRIICFEKKPIIKYLTNSFEKIFDNLFWEVKNALVRSCEEVAMAILSNPIGAFENWSNREAAPLIINFVSKSFEIYQKMHQWYWW